MRLHQNKSDLITAIETLLIKLAWTFSYIGRGSVTCVVIGANVNVTPGWMSDKWNKLKLIFARSYFQWGGSVHSVSVEKKHSKFDQSGEKNTRVEVAGS